MKRILVPLSSGSNELARADNPTGLFQELRLREFFRLLPEWRTGSRCNREPRTYRR